MLGIRADAKAGTRARAMTRVGAGARAGEMAGARARAMTRAGAGARVGEMAGARAEINRYSGNIARAQAKIKAGDGTDIDNGRSLSAICWEPVTT